MSRADGSVVWERTAVEAMPPEGTHQDGTWASASPVTDGESLYVHFGSQGLFVYDLDAKTGDVHYTEQRVEGLDNVYASIVGASGRVYLTGRNGTTSTRSSTRRRPWLATSSIY